ncbi:hypothetical protein ACOI1H_22705 [Loktanella sp. DJP18]|uniref:hypothetical protein n=1 Tax=Loktanella sp. DJP18 TaxID=3409788 RepID=UPI003BB588C0
MFEAAKTTKTLSTVADLARLLGLRPNADTEQISRTFGRMTNFDTAIAIEEKIDILARDEVWEILVEKTTRRPRVLLRQDGRGAWLSDFEDVPIEVRREFQIRKTRMGEMETLTPWEHWKCCDWIKGSGRRLKSRSGQVHAIVEVLGVGRETGKREMMIRIEPVVDFEMTLQDAVRLPLPCAVRTLVHAVENIRLSSMTLAG